MDFISKVFNYFALKVFRVVETEILVLQLQGPFEPGRSRGITRPTFLLLLFSWALEPSLHIAAQFEVLD